MQKLTFCEFCSSLLAPLSSTKFMSSLFFVVLFFNHSNLPLNFTFNITYLDKVTVKLSGVYFKGTIVWASWKLSYFSGPEGNILFALNLSTYEIKNIIFKTWRLNSEMC